MRLIRKLALRKQKHTKKKKVLFRPPRGPRAPLPGSRGSVFRTHNSGQERAQLCRAGLGPGGGGRRGESLCEYSAGSRSGPSTLPHRCRCGAQAGGGLASVALPSPSLSLSMSLLPRQQKVDDCALAGWLRGAERREVTLATCGCWEKASGEPPGSAGEVAQPRAERWPFLIFIIMHIDSGDGAERQPPALVKPILEIPDKPCPLVNAAGFGWRGGCGASVG